MHIMDISPKPEEHPETLYQRLISFVEDSLLCRDRGLTHHNEVPDTDEELSPTLENQVVVLWLRLLHQDLPKLVKQRYGTELRERTIASIHPEISQALDLLLDELRSVDDSRVLHAAVGQSK